MKKNYLKLCDMILEKKKRISIKDIMSCGIPEGRAIEMIIRFAQLSDEQIIKNALKVKERMVNHA